MSVKSTQELVIGKPGGHQQWPSDRVAEFKAGYPREFWSHKALTDVLNTAIKFTGDESRIKGEYFDYQFDRFYEAVKDIPGVLGVFGTGYPFYAYQEDGSIADIPEMRRYQDSFRSAISRDRLRSYGGWLCGACELACDLPDLKKYCKPCDSVDFKPRDIFKALPDLDYWVVVDDPVSDEAQHQQELDIQERARAAAFVPSDSNIIQTIATTKYAMETVLRGYRPGAVLPADMHVITKSALLACIKATPDAIRYGGTVGIAPRSLHKTWEDTDEPYDFIKDFLFSLTPHTLNDDELSEALVSARREVYTLVAADPVRAVADRAEKEKRQLEAPDVEKCLRRRISSWK